MIELAPSFPRGYCRAGTCYLLQGDAANARRCFEKGLECARSQPEERARAEECERRLREVKEVEEKTPQLLQQQAEYQQMVNGQQRLNRMYAELSKCGRAARLTRRELAEKKHRLAEAEQQAAYSVSQSFSDETCAALLDKVDRLRLGGESR